MPPGSLEGMQSIDSIEVTRLSESPLNGNKENNNKINQILIRLDIVAGTSSGQQVILRDAACMDTTIAHLHLDANSVCIFVP